MVCPRHAAAPLAPSFATRFQPPPTLASPVSRAIWPFVRPAVSDIFSKCDSSSWAWALPLSVTPRA